MNPSIAHIVYASDDRFAEILGVSLVSLYENSQDMDDLVVYVLDSGINEENKNKIEGISKKYHRQLVHWLPAKDINKELSMRVKTDRGSLSQYARLFVSSALPSDIDRVLYLDCDTIIVKNIRELWNLNLHGNTIGALLDAFSSQYRANIDLQKNDVMFNSGVMLIDLARWKEKRIEEQLMKFIQKKNGQIQQGDQGALNAILSRDTYCFEPRFNSVTIFYDFNYNEMMIYRKPPKGFYSKEEIEKAVEDPAIIHFTTSFLSKRPWIIGSQHKYANVWLKYKDASPWKTKSLWSDNGRGGKGIAIEVLKILPQKTMIRVAGFAQAYGRPWKNRILRSINIYDYTKGNL